MDNFKEDTKRETFMSILIGNSKKSKIIRLVIAVIYTYMSCYIINLCVDYGPPNWWSFPTVGFCVVGIVLVWAWAIMKLKLKL